MLREASLRGRQSFRSMLCLMSKTFNFRNGTPTFAARANIATTPAVLASANNFYKGAGFDLLEEKSVGNMVMNTYAKRLVHLK